jgi:L-alanine-DL-glutamate epimerase-like enolase superfamily enzyme
VKATSPAIAAAEMACWDIVGKVCNQPLVNLFGGRVRDQVEFFYYLSRATPEIVAEDARRGKQQGFRTFYLKVGSDDPRDDIARVEAIRYANQAYASLLADDVIEGGPLTYVNGQLAVPTGPGLGVVLDAERVARYADLYAREAAGFAFHDAAALSATPVLPKL